MLNWLDERLSRRRFLRGASTPFFRIGMFAAPPLLAPLLLPGSASAASRMIKASDLGLRPHPRRNQTASLLRALAEAAKKQAWLLLDNGDYVIGELEIRFPVRLRGGKQTRILCDRRARFLLAVESNVMALDQLQFEGRESGYGQEPLVNVMECNDVSISRCILRAFDGNGLWLEKCKGRIIGNRFSKLTEAAIHSQDSRNLHIAGNVVRQCENNGILVWQSTKRRDGSIVEKNDIADIDNRSGGDGPYGNGINVFRAGQVTVQDNTIRNCAYSAIRNNSGDDCKILNNTCENIGEVAIFVEFAWRRALVRGNRIRRASAGISATNMDHGARGGVIENNLVEDVRPRIRSVDVLGYGISAEADTVIRNNVVRKASECGLSLGWGPYLRNVTATRNRLEDCTYGIGISVVRGAGRANVTYNTIIRPTKGAILGFNYDRPVTGDFLRGARPPRHIYLRGNVFKG